MVIAIALWDFETLLLLGMWEQLAIREPAGDLPSQRVSDERLQVTWHDVGLERCYACKMCRI
jgi:hypothetical protein